MKSPIKPIEFISPLSEVEVRLTLRELCGSKFEGSPFDGEVDHNSFLMVQNPKSIFIRNAIYPILEGNFCEENGKTHVTVSMRTRPLELFGVILFGLGAFSMAVLAFVSMLDEGSFLAAAAAMTVMAFGAGACALQYLFLSTLFFQSASKIKKALHCAD